MSTTQSVRTHKRKASKVAPKMRAKSSGAKRKKQTTSSTTGTQVFDRSLHKTNIWLKDIMTAMNWQNRDKALSAFRATLHSLRDALPLQEIPQLASQFPILVRGLYYENWRLLQEPLKIKSVNEFYELVRTKLGKAALNFSSEEIKKFTQSNIKTISKYVSKGEMKDVKNALKDNLKVLFEDSKSSPSSSSHSTVHRKARKSRGTKHAKPVHVH